MRYSIAALALAATSVYAQSLSQLPSCALSCLVNAVPPTGCSAVDFACVCKASAILTPIVTPCAEKACSAADFAALPADLEAFCAEAGVTITVTPPTAATSTSSSAAGTTTSAAAITTAAVSTVASSSAASSSAKPSSTVSGAASGTGAVPTSTPSFISGASSNDLKIGAAALAAVAALIL